MRILIASDGSDYARQAALYACQIARAAQAETTLLGVVEKPRAEARLRASLETLRDELARQGCACALKVRQGDAGQQILAEAGDAPYHLVVIGWRGRRGLRERLFGSTTTQLVRSVRVPLLIVTGPARAIERMLICTGGGKPGENSAAVGGVLASRLGAEVTVLHVMSQVPLVPTAPVDDLERDAPELIESGTREGRHLRRVLDILSERGMARERRRARIRHGLVLDEILAEAREGDFDLLVVGAPHIPEGAAWPQIRLLLQEDMAAQIIREAHRPVLMVRWLDELGWADLVGQA